MKKLFALALTPIALFAAASCGRDSSENPILGLGPDAESPATDASVTGEAGTTPIPDDASSPEDASSTPPPDVYAPPSPCGSSPPADGEPCAQPLLACEFGTSPFVECDEVATCRAGVWHLVTAVPSVCAAETSECAGSTPATGAQCPSQSALSFDACDTAAGMVCYCSASTTATGTWDCLLHGPGCPPLRPRLGASCTLDAGSQCNYAGVDVLECTATGVWVERLPNP